MNYYVWTAHYPPRFIQGKESPREAIEAFSRDHHLAYADWVYVAEGDAVTGWKIGLPT